MTSVKVVAIAVVAILVCAVGAYAVATNLGNNGNDAAPADAIGTNVEVGDSYTLGSSYSKGAAPTIGADTSGSTEYTVASVDGDRVKAEVTEDGKTTVEDMSKDEFLGNVSVVDGDPEGTYLRTETIGTAEFGQMECWVYSDHESVGNGVTVTTYEWIGVNSNVIYKTTVEYTVSGDKEVFTTTLDSTNMIDDDGSDVTIPEAPSQDDTVRTTLAVGDFIEYTKIDDDDDDDFDRERITVERISGGYVYLDDDDEDRITVEQFLSFIVYNGTATAESTETITTVYGDIRCNVFADNPYIFGDDLIGNDDDDYDDDDDDDDDDNDSDDDVKNVRIWASVDGYVIYKIEVQDDDDVETYVLTGTSLFTSAPTTPEKPSENRYGITLQVDDYYTIQDDDGDVVTYTIVSIDGNRLLVQEREIEKDGSIDLEYDKTSANDFLDDILLTDDELDSEYTFVKDDAPGAQYRENGDDDDLIWVQQKGDNWIIQQEQDDDDVEVLSALGIKALA